ncbi:hypothetical protein FV230_07315 [Methylobacterium sp. WL6]|nr:hypothetical protein FV230_07315 [Methylobacterium sp. WL6]
MYRWIRSKQFIHRRSIIQRGLQILSRSSANDSWVDLIPKSVDPPDSSLPRVGCMPRRAAAVTQADIARVIRAVQASGLPVVRVVVRSDGVSVETSPSIGQGPEAHCSDEVADSDRVVVL